MQQDRGVYRGEGDDAVDQEIIVERGQIRATTLEELQGGHNIQAQRVRAFNGIDHLLRLLPGNGCLS